MLSTFKRGVFVQVHMHMKKKLFALNIVEPLTNYRMIMIARTMMRTKTVLEKLQSSEYYIEKL